MITFYKKTKLTYPGPMFYISDSERESSIVSSSMGTLKEKYCRGGFIRVAYPDRKNYESAKIYDSYDELFSELESEYPEEFI